MIVRWGLAELDGLLKELGLERPLLVTSARFAELDIPVTDRFVGVRRHAPLDVVADATEAAAHADGIVAVGGGSAIDTAKAVSAATKLPAVAVPTTYSGSEWTAYFGMRDEKRGAKTGGSGADTVAVVYEPALTLDLPREETVGTAMNALAHCAEALYVLNRNEDADEHALAGAALIGTWLRPVLAEPRDLEARTELLRGAAEAGAALAGSGLALGHAMAQALGGRYGLAHGALNAICLPPALRYNEPVAAGEIARFGEAMGTDDPIGRTVELARLAGFERLRDLGVPRDELGEVAEAAARRPAMKLNPRPAGPAEIEELLESVW